MESFPTPLSIKAKMVSTDDISQTQVVADRVSHTPANGSGKGGHAGSTEAYFQPSSACNGPESMDPNDRDCGHPEQYPGGWRLTAILASLSLATLLVAIDVFSVHKKDIIIESGQTRLHGHRRPHDTACNSSWLSVSTQPCRCAANIGIAR